MRMSLSDAKGMGTYVSVCPLCQCLCLAVMRGNAKYVVGSVFSEEVAAAVDDTCQGPIILMRSSGS